MARTLGVDYGTRRVGFAVSDEMAIVAVPLFIREVTSVAEAVRVVRAVAAEKGAACVVVGIPLNMDGSKGPMALQVEAFVALLREGGGLEIATWDERLSTGWWSACWWRRMYHGRAARRCATSWRPR